MDLQDLSVGLLQVPNKQWGYYVESQNPTDYRYWSIPFTSHYITMATKTYYEPKEEAVPWLVGIDMQKFICGYGANFIGSSYVSCVGIGCQLQWGKYTNSGNDRVITYPIAFSEVYYANVISPDNCETFVYGISNTNINYRLCNGYNDDRWNGTQTSRLFAVGR